jgi:hypothetical protein
MMSKMMQDRRGYADGGKVVKDHLAAPKKGRKPKKITTSAPAGGRQTPVAKGTYKMADGGKVKKAEKPSTKPGAAMLGKGAARKAADTIRDKRAKQMKDLGI